MFALHLDGSRQGNEHEHLSDKWVSESTGLHERNNWFEQLF